MTFQSGKGILLGVILWALGIVPIIGLAVFLFYVGLTEPPKSGNMAVSISVSIILAILCLLFAGFLIWTWFETTYTLTDDLLKIKYGPMKKTIPLIQIQQAGKTNSVISGPALSMKRIEITYKDFGYTVISPIDREEFLKFLKEKCPHARIDVF